MRKLSNKIFRLIFPTVLFSMIMAVAFVYYIYWLAFVCLLLIIYFAYRLYVFNLKTVNQFKLFTDSIKYSEHNLVFSNDISDDLYQEFYDSLSQALEKLSELGQKQEADRHFLNNLLNRIDFALIVVDRNDQVYWVNRFALDLLGKPKPLDIHSLKNTSDELKSMFEELQPRTSRLIKINHRGGMRSLVANLSILIVQGNMLKVYSMKDVQPIVEQTEDIAWQQLISVLTHEMMNSLTPIISLSESLSEENNDPEVVNRAIQTIYRRSRGLLEFVNNYKKLTQIPAPKRVSLDLTSLIEEVARLMKGYGVEPSVLVTSAHLQLYADRVQMEQVLINLVKNAQEACENVPNPHVKIIAAEAPYGQIAITIKDNGEGMDAETLERIFTPFYSTKAEGSGIGLSICRQIISMHGGALTVNSEPNQGSEFIIRL